MQNQIEAKPANYRAYIEAAHLLAVIALVVGLPMWFWHDHKTCNAEWLQEATAIQDPWSRYTELDHGLNRWLSSEERKQAAHLRDEALEAAVAAHVSPALELVDAQPRRHAAIIDKHPRDPARRASLMGALRVVWPEIDKMTPHARGALLRMAQSCHLHEAPPPVARETVLQCVRHGAALTHTKDELAQLMDSAVLGGPLTAEGP